MRFSVFITAAALAAAMAAQAIAQEPPLGPPGTPNPQMRQQMESMHKQMEQIHTQERSQVLGALTPAHKQLLATIAGQLATSTTPDYRGAAQQLDAALTSSEKQTILTASQSAREKMRAQMETMRKQMQQMGGAPGGRGGPPMMMQAGGGPEGAQRIPTAGSILLRVAMSGGMEMHVQASMRAQHP